MIYNIASISKLIYIVSKIHHCFVLKNNNYYKDHARKLRLSKPCTSHSLCSGISSVAGGFQNVVDALESVVV